MLYNLKKSIFVFYTIISILLFIIFLYLYINNFRVEDYFSVRDTILLINKENFSIIFLFLFFSIVWSFFQGFIIPLNIISGFIFGSFFGLILITFSTTIGHTLFYLFSKSQNLNFLNKFRSFSKKEFRNIFKNKNLYFSLARFLIFIPSQIANIFALVLKLKTKDFFLICLFAPIPMRILFIFLGDSIYHEYKNYFYFNAFNISYILFLSALIILSFISFMIIKNKNFKFFKKIDKIYKFK